VRAAPPAGPPPASAAWSEGDPPGRRRFVDVGPLDLEAGGRLPAVRLAYETWGPEPADADGVVLVSHALTGDSHVAGPISPGHPMPGWWDGLIGPGRGLDTDRFCVVCPNVLGGCQGSTGPASPAPDGKPYGSRWPVVTTRDQVVAEARLADALDIERWALVTGGSMGGMRALEWAVTYPERVAGLALVATTAAASAEQIGLYAAQVAAIRLDPGWAGGDYHAAGSGGGPHAGLAIARALAQISYRCEPELEARFGREPQGEEDPLRGGRFAVQSYLEHHGDKLVRRFDAGSYVTLTDSMTSHDVGRGRGGVAAALGRYRGPALVAGIDSDRLYPLLQQSVLADGLPGCDGLHVVASGFGHDGFLLETAALTPLMRDVLARSAPA
jgi:homoserine O-acetyltransferase/O-succinyltransferase